MCLDLSAHASFTSKQWLSTQISSTGTNLSWFSTLKLSIAINLVTNTAKCYYTKKPNNILQRANKQSQQISQSLDQQHSVLNEVSVDKKAWSWKTQRGNFANALGHLILGTWIIHVATTDHHDPHKSNNVASRTTTEPGYSLLISPPSFITITFPYPQSTPQDRTEFEGTGLSRWSYFTCLCKEQCKLYLSCHAVCSTPA